MQKSGSSAGWGCHGLIPLSWSPYPAPGASPSSPSSLSQPGGDSSPLGKKLFRAGASDSSTRLGGHPRPPRAARAHSEAAFPSPADIYDKVSGEMQKKGYACECLGGGRISHQSQDRKIHVYGYSMGYGRAQHSVSTEKIKVKYPNYEVTWADDGY
ncbi:PREDICTED: 14 kDa phosphohistidine phosphatase isoform X1 [Galeopterus variegatus]|uniref:14 kDa phosphohistidine phosphatase n=1 Tax=Galeopterus variegatus TaxID=482537 RepID=A0ABM0Q2R7_GALVR|nr:PREDICTED: 14 kDa phosphohistidine phosphatase-like [Galeopterus variegatus]XP_008592509.1 PREDICTED: 14 kDa phosphohistidine phosphatase isoform X1 [Galeopterus variegatus]